MMKLTYTVPDEYAGITVYSVLRRQFNLSATLTRRLKRAQAVLCGGSPVFTDYRLAAGETVSVDVEAAEPPCDILPEPGSIRVLLETEALLAVNKPAGILIHPSHAKNTGTLANHVAQYLTDTRGSGVCHAVNRLDRDTSGVVLFAKNACAKEAGTRALSAGKKDYLAIVSGIFEPRRGVIDLPIRRLDPENMRRVAAADGQRAVTHYDTVCTGVLHGQSVSLLRLRLETGRTHQIRVHASACGHPLLGDRLYGTAESIALSAALGLEAHLLHAAELSFTDPFSAAPVCVRAPVERADMQKILADLKINP